MNEKQSKRISKGKGGRRRKSAAPVYPPKNDHRVKAKFPSAPMARASSRHRPPESNFDDQESIRPDPSLDNDALVATVITRKLPHHQPRMQDALDKVDASFDFGVREPPVRVLEDDLLEYPADLIIPDENILANEFRPGPSHDNSFLQDSILKVNKSFGSQSDKLNGSNSIYGTKFIRKTSGRRSPGPLLLLDGFREHFPMIGPMGEISNSIQERYLDGSLLRTLPNQGDLSYDILPFAGRDVFEDHLKLVPSRKDSGQLKLDDESRKNSSHGET